MSDAIEYDIGGRDSTTNVTPTELTIDVPGEATNGPGNRLIFGRIESEAGRRANVTRPLTHHSTTRDGGLAMDATRNDIKRFWAKVNVGAADDCWTFTGALDKDGYGTFWINGSTRRAPRVAWSITHPDQSIAPGIEVRHSCDNPPCVNLAHLSLGTPKHNAQDRIDRDRTASGDRNGARLYPERLLRGADHPAYRAETCRNGHPRSRSHTDPKSGERICRDCLAASRRRQRIKRNATLSEAELLAYRAKINERARRARERRLGR